MADIVSPESTLAPSLAQILGKTGLQALGVTSPALAPAWTIDPGASIIAQTSELVLKSSMWVAPVAGILTQREKLDSDAIDADKVYLHLLPQLHDRLKDFYDKANIQDAVPRSFAYALAARELVPEAEGIYRAGEALNLKGALRVLGDVGPLEPTRVAANFVKLLEAHPILSATPRKPGAEIEFEAPQLKTLSALVAGGQIGNVASLQASSPADAMTMLGSVEFADYDLSRWKLGQPEIEAFNDIVSRLAVLVQIPSEVRQGVLNLCGPGAFLRLWFERDPLAAARYTLDLLGKDKSVRLGNINVTPDEDFRKQDYRVLVAKHEPYPSLRSLPPAADWLAMGALRGSENLLLDFEGTADETLAAMTYPSELAAWLRATGIYTEVVEDTNVWFTKSLEHALSLKVDQDHDAILLINMEMIQPPKGSIWDIVSRLVPNHYIVLNKIELLPTSSFNPKERVRLEYWSWGKDHQSWGKNVTEELDVPKFQSKYYGAISCAVR